MQSHVTEKWPGAIFRLIETSGDGAVNVYSRVQMMLFARAAARAEFEATCKEYGVTPAELRFAHGQESPPARARSSGQGHRVTTTASDWCTKRRR